MSNVWHVEILVPEKRLYLEAIGGVQEFLRHACIAKALCMLHCQGYHLNVITDLSKHAAFLVYGGVAAA